MSRRIRLLSVTSGVSLDNCRRKQFRATVKQWTSFPALPVYFTIDRKAYDWVRNTRGYIFYGTLTRDSDLICRSPASFAAAKY